MPNPFDVVMFVLLASGAPSKAMLVGNARSST